MQREKALQLAAQRSHAVASNGLQPEQQLDKPANGKVAPSTADPAVKETDQPEPSGVVEQHQPPAEEPSPGVKELEKEEVELLVWLSSSSSSSAAAAFSLKRFTVETKLN